MRCEQASQSRAVKALGVGGVSQIWIRTIKALRVVGVSQIRYSNSSLSTEYIKFIYRDRVQIILNMDEGRDGGEVKPELCPQLNTAVVESKKQV